MNDITGKISSVGNMVGFLGSYFGRGTGAISEYIGDCVIDREESGIVNHEYWFFVNARYDKETKRFKRIDKTKNSFGVQYQASGTYPGEAALGYTDNQAIGFWRAVGSDYFNNMGDTTAAEEVTEDIGALIDGEWKTFGVYYGWNNCQMLDSYGGVTIGGAGFEIDGNGIYPYCRMSLSKVEDPEGANGFMAMGLIWNGYHKFSDSDDREQDSYFVGIKAPIDYYHDGVYNKDSNFTSMEKASFAFLRRVAGDPHALASWQSIFEVNVDGTVKSDGVSARAQAEIGSNTYVQVSAYPEGFTADNTEVTGVQVVSEDGTITYPDVTAVNCTEYGIGVSIVETDLTDKTVYVVLGIKNTGALTTLVNVFGAETLPAVSADDNGKIMMVVDGAWDIVALPGGTQYDRKTITIPASAWVTGTDGSISYTYWNGENGDTSVEGCDIDVSLLSTSTQEQVEAAAVSGVYCKSSGVNGYASIEFACLYSIPTVDLSFSVRITKPHTLSYSVDTANMIVNIVEE